MKNNFLPVNSHSVLFYNEAMNNIEEADSMNVMKDSKHNVALDVKRSVPEILLITSYPPRECGIATYTQDLKNAIQEKFGTTFSVKVCALETSEGNYDYPSEVKYKINTQIENQFLELVKKVNADNNIAMIFLQHEFGLFGGDYGDFALKFLKYVTRPVTTTFHTVLPKPNYTLREVVRHIAEFSENVIVMTQNSKRILVKEYEIEHEKISVIAHGTHLMASAINLKNKIKNQFSDRIVLSTFGLLSDGKSIETALDALPKIIERFPTVLYLIIGKTHPEVVKREGEKYRDFLYEKVKDLHLENNVRFINKYLTLDELTTYLLRTKIYLFTSNDPNQAVSGTFVYAMSCGCPVLATPIPHAREFLDGAGLNYGFQNSKELAEKTIELLYNTRLLEEMRLNALHKISPTSWQNSAIAHIGLIKNDKIILQYDMPAISLNHIRRMTTKDGLIQFSAISTPNIESGYTLDDNARALIAVTKHYQLTEDAHDLKLIKIYLNFIIFCQCESGNFLNYVNKEGHFTANNKDENLEDANGRAIWALGEFISFKEILPAKLIKKATKALEKTFASVLELRSPRAIAFSIKGLYFYNSEMQNPETTILITNLADNLVSKYRGVSDDRWKWFEDYLTYANSILPEALLYASLATGSELFREIATTSFDFLLSVIFKDDQIKVISNQGWYYKGKAVHEFGEQPIDVAYTILALNTFYQVYELPIYKDKMKIAFDWFLGKNHLNQIVYNPRTGGCYDGLEQNHVNLNQGAESTVSYLLSRLTMESVTEKVQENIVYEEVLSE